MGNYEYIARTAAGQEVSGVMQADSETAVVRTLDERKLYPVRVLEQAQAASSLGLHRRGRVRLAEVGILYAQLADLLRSGVPMLRSLEILARAGTGKTLADIVRQVREEVSAGKTLAEAMGAHPKVFTSLHCAMVRAGEQAGFLEDVLTNLAAFIERQDELRSKVKGALIYPAVLTILGFVMMLGILLLLVPRFKPFFARIQVPAPTAMLFAASDMMVDHIWLLLAMTVSVVMLVRGFLRSSGGHAMWERWRMRIPGIGKTTTLVSLTRFCRILGTLLANGVPILKALEIAKDATGSVVLAQAIEQAAQNVKAGEPLAAPLRQSGLFPAQIIEMISVAEESNQLEKVLVHIADTVERRTNRQVDQAVRLVEPLILVLMGIAIGFVAVGLLYPIFTMSQTMR